MKGTACLAAAVFLAATLGAIEASGSDCSFAPRPAPVFAWSTSTTFGEGQTETYDSVAPNDLALRLLPSKEAERSNRVVVFVAHANIMSTPVSNLARQVTEARGSLVLPYGTRSTSSLLTALSHRTAALSLSALVFSDHETRLFGSAPVQPLHQIQSMIAQAKQRLIVVFLPADSSLADQQIGQVSRLLAEGSYDALLVGSQEASSTWSLASSAAMRERHEVVVPANHRRALPVVIVKLSYWDQIWPNGAMEGIVMMAVLLVILLPMIFALAAIQSPQEFELPVKAKFN